MRIGIILIAILVPSVISLIYFLIGNRHMNLPKKETDENFVVSVPKIVMTLGAMLCITIIILIIVFSLTSKELPHPIFYGIMGMFLWMGVYLVIKVLRFRVVVKGKQITVYPLFHKTFTFQFEDIVSVTHQVKNNSAKSERVVVKISTGKKFVVESSEYGYKRFLKRITNQMANHTQGDGSPVSYPNQNSTDRRQGDGRQGDGSPVSFPNQNSTD